jgi:hypothetical protein
MKQIRAQLILFLVSLTFIVVCAGCEATKIRAPEPMATPEPVASPEPPQPVITEPKVAPTPQPPPPAPSPKPKLSEGPYFMHTVRWRGESLSIIAAWYTGTVRNGRILAEANPQVTDPNKIPIGDKIRIPAKMLRTRETMPQGFVGSYVNPPKQPGAGVPVRMANRSGNDKGAERRKQRSKPGRSIACSMDLPGSICCRSCSQATRWR